MGLDQLAQVLLTQGREDAAPPPQRAYVLSDLIPEPGVGGRDRLIWMYCEEVEDLLRTASGSSLPPEGASGLDPAAMGRNELSNLQWLEGSQAPLPSSEGLHGSAKSTHSR